MADNTFYITEPLVFGNIKREEAEEREREGRNCSISPGQRYLQFSLKYLFNRVS